MKVRSADSHRNKYRYLDRYIDIDLADNIIVINNIRKSCGSNKENLSSTQVLFSSIKEMSKSYSFFSFYFSKANVILTSVFFPEFVLR